MISIGMEGEMGKTSKEQPVKTSFGSGTLALLVLFAGFASCGTNTDDPVYPILAFIQPIGAPAITSVSAQEKITDDLDYRIEFDVNYYVTNTEDEFIGYNLYINAAATSPEERNPGEPYMPSGLEPTFPHSSGEADTTTLMTQRVSYKKAPPDLIPFYTCEKYYFQLTALMRNGQQSNPSAQMEGCATVTPSLCPIDSPCYVAP